MVFNHKLNLYDYLSLRFQAIELKYASEYLFNAHMNEKNTPKHHLKTRMKQINAREYRLKTRMNQNNVREYF